MSEKPVTGQCAFDKTQVDVHKLRHLARLDPLSPAASPVPQFRMFRDARNLCVEEGEIDSSAIGLPAALRRLPPPEPRRLRSETMAAQLLAASVVGDLSLGRHVFAGSQPWQLSRPTHLRDPLEPLMSLAASGTRAGM